MHKNEYGQSIGFPVSGWSGAQALLRSPMEGSHTRLCCVENVDVCESLFAAYVENSDGTNWTYLPYGPFDALKDFRAWFESACFGDNPLFHVVYSKSNNLAIGLASLMRYEQAMGSIEVGHIHFSPALQQTPMSTEAMFLMMTRVFDELGCRRYEWKCDALNEPSKKAALRLGFTFEGIFRQALIYKGRNRDTAWFSITDKEWPAIKAGFEAWLHADNFDEHGQQVTSLANCRTI